MKREEIEMASILVAMASNPARRDRGSQGQGGTVAGQLQRDFDLPYFCDPEQ